MLPAPSTPLTQSDLTRLDQFLHSAACGADAMGLSRAHGFMTAAAIGPETVEAAEWIRLMFDEPVFESGAQADEMLGLALRLYRDIERDFAAQGCFRPVLEYVNDAAGATRLDARPWCRGFIDGMSLARNRWAAHAHGMLAEPLQVIFRLAQAEASDGADYAQLCEALPLAAEVVYLYWRQAAP